MKTVDGFPVQDGFNFLSDIPKPELNPWSIGKVVKVEVWYDDWYFNYIHGKYRRSVTWKGQTIVVDDYDWFTALVKQSMDNKFYPKTKEQALDEYFEIHNYIANHP